MSINFNGHLIILDQGDERDFDDTTLKDVKYWAFFYGASTSQSSKTLASKLVDFYAGFKKTHPNFELIFVDADGSEEAMMNFMQTSKMSWPAVRFSDLDSPRLNARKYQGTKLPGLVLTDSEGKVLANSSDLGTAKVLKTIPTIVPAAKP